MIEIFELGIDKFYHGMISFSITVLMFPFIGYNSGIVSILIGVIKELLDELPSDHLFKRLLPEMMKNQSRFSKPDIVADTFGVGLGLTLCSFIFN